ncbi:MAG: LysM peptidoglycan-binding domain-containing protein [Deltaproteobacteria bacterium]|nr:LysM peptidoglycan-binding domain-containing protein [Deltaproteobacteria bacterium]MBW2393048.1 LysM peptidoglycan-binding domain-containing protein [Deltaproteobacteria bacterium]
MSIDHRCLSVFLSFLAVGFVGCAHLTQEQLPPEPELAMEEPAPSVELPSSLHTVAPGETVWAIARRYDLTVEELVGLNEIADVRQVSVGAELIVPEAPQSAPDLEPDPELPDVAAAPIPTLDPTSHNYRVRRGETLWRIAQRHGISPGELAAMNGMQRPERLRAGRVIQVPGEAPPQECACERPAPVEIAIQEPVACEVPPAPEPVLAPAIAPVSEAPYAAIDAVLGVGDGYLDSARFDEAIDMADLGLDLLGEFWVREDAGPRIARAELLRGIAHVALERPSEGRASFRAALRIEPEIVVGADASPKVQEIFDSARTEVSAALASQ